MEIITDDDKLDPGDDYQKAKRSALAVSLVAVALSFSDVKKDGMLKVTVLAVDFNHPLVVILLLLLVGVVYCGFNFFIHARRASNIHSIMMKRLNELQPEEALVKMESILKGLVLAGGNAKSTVENFCQSIRPEMAELNYNGEEALKFLKERWQGKCFDVTDSSMRPRNRSPEQLLQALKDVVPDFIDNAVKYIEHEASNVRNSTLMSISQGMNGSISQLSKMITEEVPKIYAAADELSRDIRKISDDIKVPERLFFAFEKALMYVVLCCALVAVLSRIFFEIYQIHQYVFSKLVYFRQIIASLSI